MDVNVKVVELIIRTTELVVSDCASLKQAEDTVKTNIAALDMFSGKRSEQTVHTDIATILDPQEFLNALRQQ